MPHRNGGSPARAVFGWLNMPGVPGKNHRRVVTAFGKIGYEVVRERGHIIMSDGINRLEIPRNNPINAYTMAGLIRKAGLTREQFEELY